VKKNAIIRLGKVKKDVCCGNVVVKLIYS